MKYRYTFPWFRDEDFILHKYIYNIYLRVYIYRKEIG